MKNLFFWWSFFVCLFFLARREIGGDPATGERMICGKKFSSQENIPTRMEMTDGDTPGEKRVQNIQAPHDDPGHGMEGSHCRFMPLNIL